MNKTISEKIYELRKLKALTQAELGERLGVSAQAVSKWEKGESLPDILLLPDLCELLGVTSDTLLEMPASVKKNDCMEKLGEYAKEAGRTVAAFEAMEKCALAVDDRLVSGSASMSVEGVSVFTYDGIGMTVNGNEMLNKLLNMDFSEIKSIGDLVFDSDSFCVVSALDFCKGVSAEEIAAKTTLTVEKVESILLKLMVKGFCECDFSGAYMLGSSAYGLIAMLCGLYLCSANGRKSVNSVTKNYPV